MINDIQNKNQLKAVEIIEIILEMMEIMQIIQIVVQVVGWHVLRLVVEIKNKNKKGKNKETHESTTGKIDEKSTCGIWIQRMFFFLPIVIGFNLAKFLLLF